MTRPNTESIILRTVAKHSKRYLDKNNPMKLTSSYNDCLNCSREVISEFKKELKTFLKKNPNANIEDIL